MEFTAIVFGAFAEETIKISLVRLLPFTRGTWWSTFLFFIFECLIKISQLWRGIPNFYAWDSTTLIIGINLIVSSVFHLSTSVLYLTTKRPVWAIIVSTILHVLFNYYFRFHFDYTSQYATAVLWTLCFLQSGLLAAYFLGEKKYLELRSQQPSSH